MKKSNRGGYRVGAGRPKKENRRIKMSVTVSPETLEKLKKSGETPYKKASQVLDLWAVATG